MAVKAILLLVMIVVVSARAATPAFLQMTNPPLTGSGYVGSDVEQGGSVAINAAGDVVVVGGNYDDNWLGATWVFTRSNISSGAWGQQAKLVGSGSITSTACGFMYNCVFQGYAVAVTTGGDVLATGGIYDGSFAGAVWTFTRSGSGSGSGWAQQSKLVGAGGSNGEAQGFALAISSDGSTMAVGGPYDGASAIGAVWMYTRTPPVTTGTSWTPLGSKIVPTGYIIVGTAGVMFGTAVALSVNGTVLLVGVAGDNGGYPNGIGAVWVFTRAVGGTTFTQTQKIVGVGYALTPLQGWSGMAISADESTIAWGGLDDNNKTGAVWVYTMSSASPPLTYSAQGAKLVATGSVKGANGKVQFGYSLAMSADGNTVVSAGYSENNGVGALWAFTRTAGLWTQVGAKMTAAGATGAPGLGVGIALTPDARILAAGAWSNNGLIGATFVYLSSKWCNRPADTSTTIYSAGCPISIPNATTCTPACASGYAPSSSLAITCVDGVASATGAGVCAPTQSLSKSHRSHSQSQSFALAETRSPSHHSRSDSHSRSRSHSRTHHSKSQSPSPVPVCLLAPQVQHATRSGLCSVDQYGHAQPGAACQFACQAGFVSSVASSPFVTVTCTDGVWVPDGACALKSSTSSSASTSSSSYVDAAVVVGAVVGSVLGFVLIVVIVNWWKNYRPPPPPTAS